jgi:uncharacterized membrane protein YjjB (DUF3815 family)
VAIPVVAAASFLAGFGVAELTGVRAIGGLVLLAGGAWCARAAFRLAGGAAATALVIAAVALFVVSHLLGHLIGAWPAVIVSAALVAMVAAAILARAQSGEGEGSQEEDVVQGRLRPE